MPHTDPVERRAYIREWKLRNPEQHRWLNKLADAASNANRRAAIYGVPGLLVVADVRDVLSAGRCHWCGRSFEGLRPTEFGIDHVVALSLGGHNVRANLVASCRSCNASKFTTDAPRRWSRERDCCVSCGTTERRHIARGRCNPCYVRERPSRSRR